MKRKNILQHIGIGLAMGTADIIPGVSGGTIAFISGIYDKLVTSIARVDSVFLSYIIKGKLTKAWTYIQGTFLLQLFGGILLAIILLAHSMSFVLEMYPTYVYAFFFGLIIASIFLITYQQLPLPLSSRILSIVLGGALLGYILTSNIQLASTTTPSLMSIFIAGACASIAMILPGISGSYILLILGKYAYILETVKTQLQHIITGVSAGQRNVLIQYETIVLVVFIAGVATGLISFSKLLHRLLKHWHTTILSLLIGFMIGTLPMIRPWSGSLSSVSRIISLLLAGAGIAIIYGFHYISTTKKTTP